MGSCVDNSRIGLLLGAIAEKLDVKISHLPIAASAPELITEKAATRLVAHIAEKRKALGI